ncbi:hypothetical protein [Crocinitomix algicola]|uniref:hypothetical protein n=1 Tax=Crocinitomix algicola TaxID=1740263 RepID=UPI0008331C09|nr:hypothetical protein [Crocinitomix algicola]
MKTPFWILTFFLSQFCCAQTVFLETFDEGDNSVTGTDNTAGAVNWTTFCPGCVGPGDYFKVLGNELVALDTNVPAAIFTTDPIDITSCTLGLLVSFDLSTVGDLETCADCPIPGTDCVDWVKLEYNIDGLGWTEVMGESCAAGYTVAPGEMIKIGELLSDSSVTTPCLDIGSTLELRFTVVSSLGDEYWYFDNIMVECSSCLLPIEISSFQIFKDNNHQNKIEWISEVERNLDYFELQHSSDGVNFINLTKINAAGNSTTPIHYSYTDQRSFTGPISYYRLKTTDFEGNFTFSTIKSIKNKKNCVLNYANGYLYYNLPDLNEYFELHVYSPNGQFICKYPVKGTGEIVWPYQGFFILEVPNLNYQQKIASY